MLWKINFIILLSHLNFFYYKYTPFPYSQVLVELLLLFIFYDYAGIVCLICFPVELVFPGIKDCAIFYSFIFYVLIINLYPDSHTML